MLYLIIPPNEFDIAFLAVLSPAGNCTASVLVPKSKLTSGWSVPIPSLSLVLSQNKLASLVSTGSGVSITQTLVTPSLGVKRAKNICNGCVTGFDDI